MARATRCFCTSKHPLRTEGMRRSKFERSLARPGGNSEASPPPARSNPQRSLLCSGVSCRLARATLASCKHVHTLSANPLFGRLLSWMRIPLASTISSAVERSTVSNITRAGRPMTSCGGTSETNSSVNNSLVIPSRPTWIIFSLRLFQASRTLSTGMLSCIATMRSVMSQDSWKRPTTTGGKHEILRHSGDRCSRSPSAISANSSAVRSKSSQRMRMQVLVRRSAAHKT
mmetsp:Transcript_88046/g.188946  ORF Transcript_88046/g.188946 Transcript_88046/m.188946 type:complete len:230 (+) Transcript_88046:506-1195(+)